MTYSKTLLHTGVVFALVLLSGCFKPQGHDQTGTATFSVEKVKGNADVAEQIDGFSIPKSKIFNFSVCVKDKRTSDPVKGHEFKISGGADEQSVRTDSSGCLGWSEKIAFNFLARETYIPIERTVTAVGMQSGTRVLKLAINPWKFSTKLDDVMDLSYDKLASSSIASNDQATELPHVQVWPTKLSVENKTISTSNVGGIRRQMTLWMQPQLLLTDLQNQRFNYDLKQAQFEISASLILAVTSGGKEERFQEWSSDKATKLSIDGDFFKAQLPVVTIRNGNASSRYLLAVKMSPIKGPAGLAPFEGIYEIGSFDDLMGTQSLTANLRGNSGEGSFSFGDLKSIHDLSAKVSVPNLQVDLPAGVTRFSAFDIKSIVPVRGGEDGSPTLKILNYSITTCFVDNTNGRREATDVEFTVEQPGKTPFKKRTSNIASTLGCLQWDSTFTYQPYQAEHFILIPITFKHASGFTMTRTIALNPWSLFLFYKDMGDSGAAEFVRNINSTTRDVSRLIADPYTFSTSRARDYSIDKSLRAIPNKPFVFSIPLRVYRPSSIVSGRAHIPEPINSGNYLLKAALYLPARSPGGKLTEYISPIVWDGHRGQQIVKVRGGILYAPITAPISDFVFSKGRANLVLQILPIDETKWKDGQPVPEDIETVVDKNSGLYSPTFVAPIWIAETGSNIFLPSDELDTQLKNHPGAEWIQSRPEVLESLHELYKVSVDDLLKKSKSQEIANQWRLTEESALDKFLKSGRLEYATIYNEGAILDRDAQLATNNKVLPNRKVVSSIVDTLNLSSPTTMKRYFDGWFSTYKSTGERYSNQSLVDLVEGRREIDLQLAGRLCVLMMENIISKGIPSAITPTDRKSPVSALVAACLSDASSGKGNFDHVFSVEHIARVLDVQPTAKLAGGCQAGFSISSGFGVENMTSEVKSQTFSFDPLSAAMSAILPGVNTGLSYSFSKSSNDAQGAKEDSFFSMNTPFALEKWELDFVATSHESCEAIRISPEFWEKHLAITSKLSNRSTSENKAKLREALSRGLLLCTGVEDRKPKKMRENYFFVSPMSMLGAELDPGDIRNMPWLLDMRGAHDYLTFMNLAVARKQSNEISAKLNVPTLAIEHVNGAFAHYRGWDVATPGFYSFDSQKMSDTGMSCVQPEP